MTDAISTTLAQQAKMDRWEANGFTTTVMEADNNGHIVVWVTKDGDGLHLKLDLSGTIIARIDY